MAAFSCSAIRSSSRRPRPSSSRKSRRARLLRVQDRRSLQPGARRAASAACSSILREREAAPRPARRRSGVTDSQKPSARRSFSALVEGAARLALFAQPLKKRRELTAGILAQPELRGVRGDRCAPRSARGWCRDRPERPVGVGSPGRQLIERDDDRREDRYRAERPAKGGVAGIDDTATTAPNTASSTATP